MHACTLTHTSTHVHMGMCVSTHTCIHTCTDATSHAFLWLTPTQRHPNRRWLQSGCLCCLCCLRQLWLTFWVSPSRGGIDDGCDGGPLSCGGHTQSQSVTVVSRGHRSWCPAYVQSELALPNTTEWLCCSAMSPSDGSPPTIWRFPLWACGGRTAMWNVS